MYGHFGYTRERYDRREYHNEMKRFLDKKLRKRGKRF
jgi:hypothetical protein